MHFLHLRCFCLRYTYVYIHTYVYVHIIIYYLYILPGEVDIGGSSFSDCTISNNAGTRYLKVINNEVKLVETEQEAEVHTITLAI